MKNSNAHRREFIRTAAAFTGAMAGLSLLPNSIWAAPAIKPPAPPANDVNIIGPKEGYSPQIGTLVSMMAWLRPQTNPSPTNSAPPWNSAMRAVKR